MVRIATLSVFGVLLAGLANAGSVEIGGTSGLTSNYINQGGGAVCAAGAGNCVAGSTSGFSEANFVTTLYSGATLAGNPFAGYTQTGGEASGQTIANGHNASGTGFAMIAGDTVNDSHSATDSANYWGSTNFVTSTITVPIGVFGATDVWTMLQNEWGIVGGTDTSVTFNFGSASNQIGGYTSVTVNLNTDDNAGTNLAANNGEVRAGLICSTPGTSDCTAAGNPHNSPLSTGQSLGSGVTENAYANLFSKAYSSIGSGFYAGSSGNAVLDAQQFVFGNTYANDWLVSMTITENDGLTWSSTGQGTSGCNEPDPQSSCSQTALTAITVDTASAPEPGTVLLLITGLGCIGAARLRRRS